MARVLIVDDALMMRKMIRKMVESAGHIVVDEAVDGEQAVEMYQKHVPDVVTMDITMPGTDGIEALARIVAYDKHAKVIMVSALGQQYKVMEALEHGAKSYILKPITSEKLLAVINQVNSSTSKTDLSTKPIFECGEGRHQKSCDTILGKEAASGEGNLSLSFVMEKKDEGIVFNFIREFEPEGFSKLLRAIDDVLVGKPNYVVFDFTQSNVLNARVMQKFIDIMTIIMKDATELKISCYNEDYMAFFRNNPILKKASFDLVKKEESWRKTV